MAFLSESSPEGERNGYIEMRSRSVFVLLFSWYCQDVV